MNAIVKVKTYPIQLASIWEPTTPNAKAFAIMGLASTSGVVNDF
jgi:hypothetical protein